MNKDNLNKIINLIKKTGDKIIVLNEGEPSLVMMSFKDYENLVFSKSDFKDLTKEELMDRINKEIAFNKEEQEEKEREKIEAEPEVDVQNMESEVKQDYEIEPTR